MKSHVKLHLSKEIRYKFKCTHCDRLFTTISSQKAHINNVHLKIRKVHTCECGKVFNFKSNLIHHRQKDHLNTRFPCTSCDKVYLAKNNLIAHIERKHEPNRPKAPCDICGKMVAIGQCLLRHVKSHRQKIPCTYEGCEKSYHLRNQLNDHIETHHLPARELPCPTCSAVFASEMKLKKHIYNQHTGTRAHCLIPGCKFSYTKRSLLRKHFKRHKGIDEVTRQKLLLELDEAKGTKVYSTNKKQKQEVEKIS